MLQKTDLYFREFYLCFEASLRTSGPWCTIVTAKRARMRVRGFGEWA
jgi:hypothetical protein